MLAASVVLAVLSPMTGSFLKCWADRARAGISVADGRSFCDNCGKTLAARDLIPVISWLLAGGKSRCCHQPISPTLLLSEIASLLLALSVVIFLPQAYWLGGLLLAWGLQAIALLAGSDASARLWLAAGTALVAYLLTLLGGPASVAPLLATIGGLLGLVLIFSANRFAPKYAEAALLLPTAGVLLGPIFGAAAILLSVPFAFAHSKLLVRTEPISTTSVSVGLATATWLVWLGLIPS